MHTKKICFQLDNVYCLWLEINSFHTFLQELQRFMSCQNVSKWQQGGVTVINPSPPHACHRHNKATKPDAKASPHIYCYNYLTFTSTLMSPGWSPSLSSFGFRALLLSNKVTFHNALLRPEIHIPLINIHPPASAQPLHPFLQWELAEITRK